MSDRLPELRNIIDQMDREIIERLNKRAEAASEIGTIKAEMGAAFYVPSREEEVFQRLADANNGPLPDDALRLIFREVISACISLEKRLNVAYLGPEGTFTQQAATRNFGSSVQYVPLRTIPDVFEAVEKKEADYGVIPIENSNEGGVLHAMDMLVESDLKIVAQVYLPIEHCLISNSDIKELTHIYSKDQALGQCRQWLARNMPDVHLIATDSTTREIDRARDEKGIAVIGSELAAHQHNVGILKKGTQDNSDNITRFLVIGREPGPPSRGELKDKTSLLITMNDESGALQRSLTPFGEREINLTKIESRPSRRKAWNYVFFIDCEGHWDDDNVQSAVAELKKAGSAVKWLGSYPNNQGR